MVMVDNMLQHLFYTLVIVPLVTAVADQLVKPLQDKHEDRPCLRHVSRVAYEPGRVQFLVKRDYVLTHADM